MIEPQELEVTGYRGLVVPCVRYDVDGASGIALILPAAARSGNRLGGTPARPDLHFTRALLQHTGLAVLEAWWDAGSAPREDLDAWIATNADAVVDAATNGDELFDVAFAETLQASGVEVVVLEGADHGLAVDDPIESAQLLTHVLRRMRAFVERVGPDV